MRVRLVLLPIIVAAAFLAGCTKTPTPTPAQTDNGVAALPAEEILAKAKTALMDAPAYTFKGEAQDEGTKVTFDLQVSGKNKKSIITAQGITIEVIVIESDVYFKVPDEVLAQVVPAEQQPFLTLIKGKYIKVAANDTRFSEVTSGLDPADILKPEGTVTKGEQSVVDGIPVILLNDTKDGSVVGTLAVSTVGEPRPIQITGPPGVGSAKFTYPASLTISPPPSDQVFDLKSLIGTG